MKFLLKLPLLLLIYGCSHDAIMGSVGHYSAIVRDDPETIIRSIEIDRAMRDEENVDKAVCK